MDRTKCCVVKHSTQLMTCDPSFVNVEAYLSVTPVPVSIRVANGPPRAALMKHFMSQAGHTHSNTLHRTKVLTDDYLAKTVIQIQMGTIAQLITITAVE